MHRGLVTLRHVSYRLNPAVYQSVNSLWNLFEKIASAEERSDIQLKQKQSLHFKAESVEHTTALLEYDCASAWAQTNWNSMLSTWM